MMVASDAANILIDGHWVPGMPVGTFDAANPRTGDHLGTYPVSSWSDVDAALDAGSSAYRTLTTSEPTQIAAYLESLARLIESHADEICELAASETGLPLRPRLLDVELPRTTDQLRQAAAAAVSRSWTRPTLSPDDRIASMFRPIPGTVAVFGPNNFPLAFNGVAGGDFAAAIATAHPVLAKANPGHPGTTRLLADLALKAAGDSGLPAATVQLVYRMAHDVGTRLVADPRIAATAYTGSRAGGLALKTAADNAGKPIYLEMSSVNPTVVLPGAWRERGANIADELATSMLLGVGQFCTSPGIVFWLRNSDESGSLTEALSKHISTAEPGTLLDDTVESGLSATKRIWLDAGAEIAAESSSKGPGCSFPNTIMRVDADIFIAKHQPLQTEAFGNMSLVVEVDDAAALVRCLEQLEGSLTGSIYSAHDDSDDSLYDAVVPVLTERVGRLLNDKPPTGVAVVPSMNHGGPYPSTGHPGFTAVGIPASLTRFAMLQCYDGVRPHRLPDELKPGNPLGLTRLANGEWTNQTVEW